VLWLKKIVFIFSKNKIIYNFVRFVATKNGRTKKFSPSSFGTVVDPGSRMDKNQDPG
jgi:hypothetical protein